MDINSFMEIQSQLDRDCPNVAAVLAGFSAERAEFTAQRQMPVATFDESAHDRIKHPRDISEAAPPVNPPYGPPLFLSRCSRKKLFKRPAHSSTRTPLAISHR